MIFIWVVKEAAIRFRNIVLSLHFEKSDVRPRQKIHQFRASKEGAEIRDEYFL